MTAGAAPMPRAEAAELLGVPQDADAAVVQRAFLRAARHVHPDTLQDADEAAHREAAAAFDRLLRAREVLLESAAPGIAPESHVVAHLAPDARSHRRGLGGSLVVLALLAFLLVAIVTAQEGMRPQPFGEDPGAPPGSSQAP